MQMYEVEYVTRTLVPGGNPQAAERAFRVEHPTAKIISVVRTDLVEELRRFEHDAEDDPRPPPGRPSPSGGSPAGGVARVPDLADCIAVAA